MGTDRSAHINSSLIMRQPWVNPHACKMMSVALAAIALVTGAVILAGAGSTANIGITASGWTCIGLGLATLNISLCLYCVKKHSLYSKTSTVFSKPAHSENSHFSSNTHLPTTTTAAFAPSSASTAATATGQHAPPSCYDGDNIVIDSALLSHLSDEVADATYLKNARNASSKEDADYWLKFVKNPSTSNTATENFLWAAFSADQKEDIEFWLKQFNRESQDSLCTLMAQKKFAAQNECEAWKWLQRIQDTTQRNSLCLEFIQKKTSAFVSPITHLPPAKIQTQSAPTWILMMYNDCVCLLQPIVSALKNFDGVMTQKFPSSDPTSSYVFNAQEVAIHVRSTIEGISNRSTTQEIYHALCKLAGYLHKQKAKICEKHTDSNEASLLLQDHQALARDYPDQELAQAHRKLFNITSCFYNCLSCMAYALGKEKEYELLPRSYDSIYQFVAQWVNIQQQIHNKKNTPLPDDLWNIYFDLVQANMKTD